VSRTHASQACVGDLKLPIYVLSAATSLRTITASQAGKRVGRVRKSWLRWEPEVAVLVGVLIGLAFVVVLPRTIGVL
jgi:hypothetical protein